MTETCQPESDDLIRGAIERALAAAREALLLEHAALAQVPLVKADELLAALTGPAAEAVLAARFDQIVTRGHDAESDDMLPLCWLPKKAQEFAAISVDRLGGIDPQRNLVKGRQRLAETSALAMASIDRLDRATKGGLQ